MVCSKCGKEFTDDVRFCTNCGTELTVAPEAEAEAEVEVVAEETTETAEEVQEITEESTEATTDVAVVDEVIKVDDVEVEENKNRPAKTKEEKKAEKLAKKQYVDADKKPKSRLKLGIALAAAVVLLFIIIGLCSGGEKYTTFSDKSVLDYVRVNDKVSVRFMDGKSLELSDEVVLDMAFNMDRTVAAFINSDGELDIIREGKLIHTGIDDVDIDNVRVSNNGATLVYYSDTEYDKTLIGTLHLYYIKKGKDIEVEKDVVVDSAVLSPNGETVAFVADYDSYEDFKGYYSVKGKKTEEIGKEKRAFAIADKAKYIYYADGDRIYAQKKRKEAEKLASDIYGTEVLFNADCTEIFFMNAGKAYVSVKAGEKKKIAGAELNNIVLDSNAATANVTVRAEQGKIKICYTGVETLKENIFCSDNIDGVHLDDELFYVKKNFEAEKIAYGTKQYAVAEDGKSLIFIIGSEIAKVTDFDKGGVRKLLTDDAEAFMLRADGELKYIYYLNEDYELHCLKGKKDKKIAEDVTSFEISEDGEFCYYTVEKEEFCYSKKGGKGKSLLEDDDVNVTCQRAYDFVKVTVTGEDKVDVYLMDGKKMKEFYSYETDLNSYLDEDDMDSYLEDLINSGEFDSIFDY